MLQNKKDFFLKFLVVAFFMKIIAEIIHEIFGHGLFVLLFGGEITGVYISILWPYELSYVNWHLPDTVTSLQLAWIYAGGIVMCLFASFLAQTFLLLKKKIAWLFALTLFWFSFWTLVNSTGYLILGGLNPFGDIYELIRLKALTSFLSLILGMVAFATGFVALSWILRKILFNLFPYKKASLGVVLFWFIIPLLGIIMHSSPERNLPVGYLLLMFIPMLSSFFVEYFLVLSKQEANKNPYNIAKE